MSALRELRLASASTEYEIHRAIAEKLSERGIPYQKEVELGTGSRIDFLIPGGIGIEVKKGKPNAPSVTRQVERYATYPRIKSLILLVEKNVATYPTLAHDKPVVYLSLSKQWGISL